MQINDVAIVILSVDISLGINVNGNILNNNI